jgi:hypothetical protein
MRETDICIKYFDLRNSLIRYYVVLRFLSTEHASLASIN